MPQVSIIIPAYNAERFIAETLDSVFTQTFQDFEIIVVDDGSRDNTAEVVKKYGSKIRFFQKENGGVSAARNFGIKESMGKYIAFLDADDTWHPTKLEKQVELLNENPNKGLCFTWIERINEHNEVISQSEIPAYDDYCKALLLYLCFVTCSSVMLRKEVCKNLVAFDSRYSNYEDLDFWLRLSLVTDFIAVPEYLVQYRVVKGSASFNNPDILEGNIKSILRDFFSLKNLPGKYKKLQSQCYSNHLMVLSGEYFHAKRYLDSLRCASEAVYQNPANITKPLGLPIRWLKRLKSTNIK